MKPEMCWRAVQILCLLSWCQLAGFLFGFWTRNVLAGPSKKKFITCYRFTLALFSTRLGHYSAEIDKLDVKTNSEALQRAPDELPAIASKRLTVTS